MGDTMLAIKDESISWCKSLARAGENLGPILQWIPCIFHSSCSSSFATSGAATEHRDKCLRVRRWFKGSIVKINVCLRSEENWGGGSRAEAEVGTSALLVPQRRQYERHAGV